MPVFPVRIERCVNRGIDEFALFLAYCKILKPGDTPEYGVLREMFSEAIKGRVTRPFDWEEAPASLPTANISVLR